MNGRHRHERTLVEYLARASRRTSVAWCSLAARRRGRLPRAAVRADLRLSAVTLYEFLRARLAEDGDVNSLALLRHDMVNARVLVLRYADHPEFRREWL